MQDEEELEKIEEELLKEAAKEEVATMKVDNRSIYTIRDTIVDKAKDAQ